MGKTVRRSDEERYVFKLYLKCQSTCLARNSYWLFIFGKEKQPLMLTSCFFMPPFRKLAYGVSLSSQGSWWAFHFCLILLLAFLLLSSRLLCPSSPVSWVTLGWLHGSSFDKRESAQSWDNVVVPSHSDWKTMTVGTMIRMKKTAHRKMVRRKKQNETRVRAAARGRWVLCCTDIVAFGLET